MRKISKMTGTIKLQTWLWSYNNGEYVNTEIKLLQLTQEVLGFCRPKLRCFEHEVASAVAFISYLSCRNYDQGVGAIAALHLGVLTLKWLDNRNSIGQGFSWSQIWDAIIR